MAQYDLTNQLSEYMDLHLVFPLLEFLSTRRIYDEASLTESKYKLLQVPGKLIKSFCHCKFETCNFDGIYGNF